MAFKSFRLQIIVRVVLLASTLAIVLLVFENDAYFVSSIILLALFVLQMISLIRYAEQTNRKLIKLFESIRFTDFTTKFSDNDLGRSFQELNAEFNQVIDAFNKNKTEKEEHFNYLLTVIQHVSIGIIVFKRDGTVDVYNNAVKKLLQVSSLRNIKNLKSVSEDLPEVLLGMRAGEKELVKLFVDDELIQLSIYATQFKMRGEEFLLVSFQDINPELEQKEIESWQKLIRVLTHEIMNSITPISSLAATVSDIIEDTRVKNPPKRKADIEAYEDVAHAMQTIEKRSKGLLNFVEIYRNLTRIPKPTFRYFEVKDLIDRASELLATKFEELEIKVRIKILPSELKILADPDLIDQVIINLLLNAIDAVKGLKKPEINIIASINLNNRVTIEISDNGNGIKPDILDKIFMPFFTSKKTGSGIGLSLSRQIMQMHKGSISVRSKQNEGAAFTIIF
ncbi:MAG: GHKL domain-containing protein [Chlorobi bacterium]|nr:GHKL domain-containing protein [Chlorobiota bacterium]